MRRGLIVRSKTELPDAALQARVERVRAAMATEGLDALVVYTNNAQTAGVSWLTGFVPYWSEALLVVPRDGEPRLVAALSYRVKSWIERTSRVAEVIHTPRIGLEAGRLIGASKTDAVVGVVDFDTVTVGMADDLREGGPGLRLSDASGLFARLRSVADSAEVALATRAAEIAQHALAAVPKERDDLGAIIAAVEAQARLLGAEEIYIAAAPDLARDQHLRRIEGDAALGDHFALRATVAYMGTWIRLGRNFSRVAVPTIHGARAAEQFAHAVVRLPSPRAFETFSHWLVEGCRTTQPLAPLMGSGIADPRAPVGGMLVSVQARMSVEGQPVYISAPALIGSDGAAARLIIDL